VPRMSRAEGEQLAQVNNPDPFAPPIWRSPVHRTPELVIWIVQLARLLFRLVRFVVRHPWLDLAVATVVMVWLNAHWGGLIGLAAGAAFLLAVWRWRWPDTFRQYVTCAARNRWRWWFYRRRWQAAMTLARLAPNYQGRVLLPVLAEVTTTGATDLVRVQMVTGQAAKDFADRAENLAHAFKAHTCRVRSSAPGSILLELVRRDALAHPIPALPIAETVDLAALPLGRCEDGTPWRLRLLGTHVLVAGATGSGKGSVIWSAVRALQPAIAAGWVRVWACDPKRMELSFGRRLFARYADAPTAMVALLEDAVGEMQWRAGAFGGKTRTFTPSAEHPFLVVVIDELAFLTAYQPERDLRKRAEAAIATLSSQGRSVGVCVFGALQDPRKEVINLRNLFPTRIALRLDESEQADMVLGDGARDRGALADQISPLPHIGAGVGYVRLETSPDPARVRAAYVSDHDITAMTGTYAANAHEDPPAAGDEAA
jgi:DNA segregation ATPase FtsK/SpoIIIE, S-DNA-T family